MEPQTKQRRAVRTYLPTEESREGLVDLTKFFHEIDGYLDGHGRAVLKSPDGTERELPRELYDVLEQVATALANGNGVTVAPYGMLLTTQEAADFLGISRPTLVKLLTQGDIPYEKRGRHRRVTLRDLVDYQGRFRVARRSALREMSRDAQRSGISEAVPGELERIKVED